MARAPLVLTPRVIEELHNMRRKALTKPVDIVGLEGRLKTPEGHLAYRRQMERQTASIPGPHPYAVTFSVEEGASIGPCRHMSMSVLKKGRVPSTAAIGIVAEELGFVGSFPDWKFWIEDLGDDYHAVNVLQPVSGLQVRRDFDS